MYKITIEQINTVTAIGGNSWDKVGESDNPYNNNDQNDRRHQVKAKEGIYSVYGYTPKYEITKTETIEILKQTVEKIDLAKVIKAINDL
jgi:hypothetical protein